MPTVNKGWVFVSSSVATTTPGGANTQVQFNDGGSFGGDADFTWNKATNRLTVTGSARISGDLSASANISASSFYGDGSNLTGLTASAVNVADGPQFSLQFRKDTPISGEISGSKNLHFVTSSTDQLHLTGNLYVKGNAFIGNGTGGGSIFVLNDTNTRIRFGPNGADSMSIEVGGKRMFLADENGTDRVILGTDSTDNTILSGNLLVCNGTASISHLSGCSNINVLSPMSSSFPISASSFFINGVPVSAGGTPGGSTGQVQFNDGGSFGGDADFKWSKTANRLTITGSVHVSSSNAAPNEIIIGNGSTRLIGMAEDDGDYLQLANAAGAIAFSSSAGFEYVGGGSAGLELIGVSGLKLYGDENGDKLSGSFLKSGVISGSSLTLAGAVTSSLGISKFATVQVADLTAGRVPTVGPSGKIVDQEALTFNDDGLGGGKFFQVRDKGPGGNNFTGIMAKTASISVLNAAESGLLAYLGHDGKVSASSDIEGAGALKIAGVSTLGGNVTTNGNSVTLNSDVTVNSAKTLNVQKISSSAGVVWTLPSTASQAVLYFAGSGKDYFKFDTQGRNVVIGSNYASTNVSGRFLVSGAATFGSSLEVCSHTASIAHLSGCSNINVHSPISSSFTISASAFYLNGAALSAGGGGSPGGSDGQVQFNNGGSFGGLNTFTYDDDGLGAGRFLQVRTKGPAGNNFTGIVAKTASISILNAAEDGLLAYLGHDGKVSASSDIEGAAALKIAGATTLNGTLTTNGSTVTLNSDVTINSAKTLNTQKISSSAGVVWTLPSTASQAVLYFAGSGKDYLKFDTQGRNIVIGSNYASTNVAGRFLISGSTTFGDKFTTPAAMIGKSTDPKVTFDAHYTGSLSPVNLSNDTGGGDVVYFGTSSANLVAGGLYYLTKANGWRTADASVTGSGHNQLLAIALGTKAASSGMLIRGFFDAHSFYSGSFIKGGPVYIQSSSAASPSVTGGGYFSSSAPTTSNSYVRTVGYATGTPNVIYFNPDGTYVELA